jgi:hypothetical protein
MATFSKLIRQSNFASFNPKLPQIFVASPKNGWGFKRAVVPSLADEKHLQVDEFDTGYGFARHVPASLAALRRQVILKTLSDCAPTDGSPSITASTASTADRPSTAATTADHPSTAPVTPVASEKSLPNLYSMSDDEFAVFLEKAKSKRAIYQNQLKEWPIGRSDPAFLCRTMGVESTFDKTYPLAISMVHEKMGDLKIGKAVQGRVLNRVDGGYAISVAGIVAFLPTDTSISRTTLNMHVDRTKLQTFYVESVKFSRDGEAMVTVSARPLTSGTGQTAVESGDKMNLQSLLSDLLSSTSTSSAAPLKDGYRSQPRRAAVTKSAEDDAIFDQLSDFLTNMGQKASKEKQ